MISLPSNAPAEGPPPGGCGKASKAGDPVDCFTGLFQHEVTDLFIDDVFPLEIQRSYRQRDPASRAFGIGTNLSYDLFLIGDTSPWTYQELVLPDGGRVHYVRISPGTTYTDAVYQHTTTPTKYFGSTITWRGGDCYWELKMKDGSKICFPESMASSNARAAAAVSISDRAGNTLAFSRDGLGNLTKIISPSSRYVQISYDAKNRITSATDNIGRTVSYEYDATGHLVKATDPAGKSEMYTYDVNHNMLTVQDKRGNVMVTNTYDANNRVATQTYADNTTNKFAYTLDTNNKVTQTDVTDERNIVARTVFNANGYPISFTRALGLPEQQTVTVARDPVTNLVQSNIDALGRKSTYTYDSNGNRLTTTLLAGTANAVTSSLAYTPDFNRVATVTDFLQHTTVLNYDTQGNLSQIKDPNNNSVKYSYNGVGQITQITNPLGKNTTLGYDGYDLAQVTDPLARTSSVLTDGLGRPQSSTDPLGNRTRYDINALDQTTAITDPLNRATGMLYDENGNGTQVTDAKGNQHQFNFDKRNAIFSVINPLNKAESYVYDNKHNLIQKTDRNNQVTQYGYDGLDRLHKITYADNSTVVINYDQGNRVIQLVDSLNGTISRTYDDLDRMTSITTAKGTVSYTYYANGLRKTMAVGGQPILSYTYDNGDRLIRIDQAAGPANNNVAQSIRFNYDAANRRTQTVLANGITVNYSYDDASQLIAITYQKPDNSVIGDLSYSYDAAGRRIATGGSFARTTLPDDMPGASFDATNRLTALGPQSLSYDANGNLISDGNQSYIWNARNQLVQIKSNAGTVIANFSYDALGRRQTKSIGGIDTGYVYDGINVVQELNATNVDNSLPVNVRASYISGGVDEVFAQLMGSGASASINSYLSDVQGSTLRLADATGNKVVDYTYDPYGNTTADAIVNNPFQYTGRENDNNGLYYYRARYYSPAVGRFISSDPIGLAGGINTYTYVGGNPVDFSDPLGLARETICNGTDCYHSPYEPSPNGPTPGPNKLPKASEGGPSLLDRILGRDKKPRQYSCSDVTGSLGACYSCCASRSPGQYLQEQGTLCQQHCNEAAGISQNESNPNSCSTQ
ncbi:RHS repeat-associated core domain-containing protein [Collimonas arenae]|nr:RHS repeat-associated core domain-containing protein [Collimonas arenae]